MDLNRLDIEQTIASEDWLAAANKLRALWLQDSTPAAVGFVVASYEKLRHAIPLAPYKVAVLRSYTIEPIIPLLRAHAFAHALDLQVEIGDFNGFVQELLDTNSIAYRSGADAVILATLTRDVAPELWGDTDPGKHDFSDVFERVRTQFASWIQHFRSHSPAHLIIHTLEKPRWERDGLLDGQRVGGQSDTIERINQELRRLSSATPGTFVLDYDALVARHGRLNWQDDAKWYSIRFPMAANHLSDMAFEWLRFIVPLSGKIVKAIALDLDNTLWGGVIGEDGFEGIKLGVEYPGVMYQTLQRRLLDLFHRGILLTICSKNNYDEAMSVLKDHPGMILRPEHFAAVRINWNEKFENVRDIARELNLGLDSFAFVDDNPIEREQMRRFMPEVFTIDLPQNPIGFAETIQRSPVFERLQLSHEDRSRAQYYSSRTKVANLASTAASVEEFLASLEQRAEIQPLTPLNLSRVVQLTQKTNQFNVTTRRYSEQELLSMQNGLSYEIAAMRILDRFGDNGVVGLAITRDNQGRCLIDTFLLSCRVIGRGVETALLSHVCEQALVRGVKIVEGVFVPTPKNAAAQGFFEKHGFALVRERGQATTWELDLTKGAVTWPRWVTRAAETSAI